MEKLLTSKDMQTLIDCITRYYSNIEIISLGRNIGIDSTEYYNPMMTNEMIANAFIERVIQLSKQEELLKVIQNHTTLRRKNIIDILGVEKEVSIDKTYTKSILHISDIHLGTMDEAKKYEVQLKIDLLTGLNIREIEYMVISGDIANRATKDEYDAALSLINNISSKFHIDRDKIIIVPGNHDLNWDISKEAVLKSQETLKFDEEIYKKRFDNFNKYFFRKIHKKTYPIEYDKQDILYEDKQKKILFLGLNSAWQIDHHNKKRASIEVAHFYDAIDKISNNQYNDWLKIVVFHHPLKGEDSMKNEFLDLLIRLKFKVCMHGHIHEAKYDFSDYDYSRRMVIIGAGTFGAPAKEQVTGIPLQYNFIQISSDNKSLIVNTRRKEKRDGAWEADSRWGDKDNPNPFYEIQLNKN